MAETPKQISNMNTSASCATFWHRFQCNRSPPPHRVDSRWRYYLLRVRKLWSRFVCLYEVLRETNSIRESKEECRSYQREICSIYRKVKRQRADELVVLVENVAHATEQIATTKRAISGKISVSSTPTRLKAKLDKIDIKATLRNQSQIDENIVISRHEFTEARSSSVSAVMFFTAPAIGVLRSRSTFQILEGSLWLA